MISTLRLLIFFLPGAAGRPAPSFVFGRISADCSASTATAGHGVENISAVSTKSIASTPSDEMTTVRVVA